MLQYTSITVSHDDGPNRGQAKHMTYTPPESPSEPPGFWVARAPHTHLDSLLLCARCLFSSGGFPPHQPSLSSLFSDLWPLATTCQDHIGQYQTLPNSAHTAGCPVLRRRPENSLLWENKSGDHVLGTLRTQPCPLLGTITSNLLIGSKVQCLFRSPGRNWEKL